ncbi:hypothetical protein KDA23_05805 [Candidatus Saccharibacteria bacterium]|nr:hypothetical protein [Candidatus Saccharibacteria bacterium]
MSNLKQWVLQMRYPYTAGVIALIWIGSALLAIIRPEIPAHILLLLVATATLIIAIVGFTAPNR